MQEIENNNQTKTNVSYGASLFLQNWMSFIPGSQKLADSFKKSAKEEVLEAVNLNDQGTGKCFEVAIVHNISSTEFHRKYLKKGLPVVFKGAAKNWKSSEKWSFDFFGENYGNETALLVEAEGLTAKDTAGNYEILKISDLIENLKKGGNKYLRFSPLLDKFPKLKEDLDLGWLKSMRNPLSIAQGYQLFIGGKGRITRLHNALQANLFVQVKGKKKWRLYPTFYSPVIDPPKDKAIYNFSYVDIYNPDPKDYPGFEKLNFYEVTLEEGDVFYIPPFMWHQVENMTDSIAVGHRFGYLRGAFKASVPFTIMRLLANDPPLWKSFFYDLRDLNFIFTHTNGNYKEVEEKYKEFEKQHAKK